MGEWVNGLMGEWGNGLCRPVREEGVGGGFMVTDMLPYWGKDKRKDRRQGKRRNFEF